MGGGGQARSGPGVGAQAPRQSAARSDRNTSAWHGKVARPSGSRSQLRSFGDTSLTHAAWGREEAEGSPRAPTPRPATLPPAPPAALTRLRRRGRGSTTAPARPGGSRAPGGLGAARVRGPAEAGQQPRRAAHGVGAGPRRRLVPREAGRRQQQAQRQGGGHQRRGPGHGDAGGGRAAGLRASAAAALYLRRGARGREQSSHRGPPARSKKPCLPRGGQRPHPPRPCLLLRGGEPGPRPLPVVLPGEGLSGSSGPARQHRAPN